MTLFQTQFFSDPFFTLSVLFNSWMPGMMDALFQSTFLCSLLMFWLCIYHGLRQNERKFVTFYLPKLIVIMPMWLCAIVLATWEKYNELRDPTYNHFVDTGNFQVMMCDFILSLIMMFVCVFVFVFRIQLIKICQFFSGFSNIFLRILCNVLTLPGITHTEGLQWTQINAIFRYNYQFFSWISIKIWH